ncbi:hypothetical protein F5Y12DRAFT_764617 [Xylaria sp. FL1777]|nr:hypothetical protein F5Y12DRAFT_764617 [Xylaria sp. FL1777]
MVACSALALALALVQSLITCISLCLCALFTNCNSVVHRLPATNRYNSNYLHCGGNLKDSKNIPWPVRPQRDSFSSRLD